MNLETWCHTRSQGTCLPVMTGPFGLKPTGFLHCSLKTLNSGRKNVPKTRWNSLESNGTCCKLSSGEWGCCPLPNAVCCKDGNHCCPQGYVCVVSAGTCSKNSEIGTAAVVMANFDSKRKHIVFPFFWCLDAVAFNLPPVYCRNTYHFLQMQLLSTMWYVLMVNRFVLLIQPAVN